MHVKLDKKWVDYLMTQPESGMGYQKVNIRLKDQREFNGVLVLNAEQIELPVECADSEIEEIRLNQ